MNYYGLFMAMGWLFISYDLENEQKENKLCNLNIETSSSICAFLTICGSKIFQRVFRNTWEGNASHGAFFGFLFFVCLFSNICDMMKLLNHLSNTLPILFFMIRLGNFCNEEHYSLLGNKYSKYIPLIEGFFQGPVTYLILQNVEYENPIILFIIIVSSIRIFFEFFRDQFDNKNILISLSTILTSLYLPNIIQLRTIPYLIFLLDIVCKQCMSEDNIRRNYGFNFSLFSGEQYQQYNKYIHIIAFFAICNFWKSEVILLGAISNLVDRLYNGYVKDYITFPMYPFTKYSFNLADVLVTGGLIYQVLMDSGYYYLIEEYVSFI